MRNCRIWLNLPHGFTDTPHTFSSQTLQDLIKREIRGADCIETLQRRYFVMNTQLRLMLEREELHGPVYSRLKILLRSEYEDRWEALRHEDD